MNLGGYYDARSASLITAGLNHYINEKNWGMVIYLYEALVKFEPKNIDAWAGLARAYSQTGMIEEAKAAAWNIVNINPVFEGEVGKFIDSLK